MANFFHHYLELEQLDGLTKDAATFPDFDETIAALFEEETLAFVREVLAEGNGDWRTLLQADWTMVNEPLAAYYGIEGVDGEAFRRVSLNGQYHAGMLTHGSITATRGRANSTAPVHRGMFVRAKLLCGDVPDVPEGLEVNPPDPDPDQTYREILEQHREDPTCASCHDLMDPLGFAFEHFGGDGRFRMRDGNLPVDATGTIAGSDVNGDFDGVPELAAQIIDSPQAQACFGEAMFEFSAGRAYQHEDACSMEIMLDAFRDGRFDVRELVVGITQSDAFLYRAVDQDQLPAPPLSLTGVDDEAGEEGDDQ